MVCVTGPLEAGEVHQNSSPVLGNPGYVIVFVMCRRILGIACHRLLPRAR